MGGINHYLLPLWNGRGLQSPKYGNIAIDKLISKMLNLGSNINDLQAKIFGGASVLENSNKGMRIGEQNIIIVNDMLAAYKIPIISSSVGGFEGIKLIFHSDNGAVFLKRTHKSQE